MFLPAWLVSPQVFAHLLSARSAPRNLSDATLWMETPFAAATLWRLRATTPLFDRNADLWEIVKPASCKTTDDGTKRFPGSKGNCLLILAFDEGANVVDISFGGN